jgi:hypothetical protein
MLPNDPTLDIATFSRIFKKTTNSYKLLLFKSILTVITNNSHTSGVVDSRQLANLMLAHAWIPSVYYKLNLGSQDKIHNYLTELSMLNIDFVNKRLGYFDIILDTINQSNTDGIVNKLMRYAPFRLLAPFADNNLVKCDDYAKNKFIASMINNDFDKNYSIYKIKTNDSGKFIELIIHPYWLEYLKINNNIVHGWVNFNWIQYLQTKNPNTPSIPNKITLEKSRLSVAKQREFWDLFLSKNAIECIFTGEILTSSNYQLDHFLPWTYVAHNQYWNLIPIISNCNSSKSNKLPNKSFIENYTAIHFKAMEYALKNNKEAFLEDYLCSLHCKIEDLKNETKFKHSLTELISNLIDSAALQGFEPNWTWKQPYDSLLQSEVE